MPRDTPYLQVADALRARVRAGEWAVGDKLPSRARFAEEYGVGQSVAQRAMERLIIEGILEGRPVPAPTSAGPASVGAWSAHATGSSATTARSPRT